MKYKLTDYDIRIFFSSIADGASKLDAQGNYVYVNKAYASMFGYDSFELIGKPLETTICVPETTSLETIYENVKAKGKITLEVKGLRKDKSSFFQEITMIVAHAIDGSLEGYYCVARDINHEQHLKRKQKWYEELYRKTPVMLHSIDKDGKLISVTDFWLEKLGYAREEVIGKRSTDFMTEESRERSAVVLKQFFKTGVAKNIPYQMVKKNGQLLDTVFSAVGEKDEKGHFLRSFTLIEDMTKFNQQNAIIKEFYEIGLNNSFTIQEKIEKILALGLSYFNLDYAFVGRVENQQCEVLYMQARLGDAILPAGTIQPLSNTYCDLVYRSERVVAYHNAVKDQVAYLPCYKVHQVNTYIGCPLYIDGALFGVVSFAQKDARLSPFSKNEKEFAQFMAQWIGNKLTHHQFIAKLQESKVQLKKAIQSLERSNDELERFAYVCSHDLQEPLRMVSSFSGLLKERLEKSDKLDDKELQYLRRIEAGAQSAQGLVNSLLSYAKLEKDPANQVTSTIHSNNLVDDILTNFDPLIAEKKARITVSPLPMLEGNIVQIFQLFQNLITNALKFTTSCNPEIWIGYEKETFFIKDNGIGIDPKYHEKIFEPFQRLDRKNYSGVGMGLTLCKKVVESYGGNIWCESQIDKGTCFYFTLPLALEKIQQRVSESIA